MKLSDLNINDTAIIAKIEESEYKQRLMENGFVPNQEIKILAKLSKSGNIAISLKGTILASRSEIFNTILVNKI